MAVDLTSIRSALASDATALAGAHEDAWRLAYQGIIPHLHLEAMIARRDAGWWVRAIARRVPVAVLEYDGQAVGYASYGRSRMRNTPYQGEIFEIYVSPVYQGLGFGSRLFSTARSALKDRHLPGLVVWALADNQIAYDFYLHRGGREITQATETFGEVKLRKIAFAWT